MAALTPTDIASMALGLLTEAPIDSLDEDGRAARMLNLHYETTREAELTKREWVFARKTIEVEAADTGMSEWPYAYELPADALRVLPLMSRNREISWRQEGSQLYTFEGGDRTVRYIANLIDPNDWPAVFIELFAAALAVKVAHPITGKANMIEVARQAYNDAASRAYQLNAVQKGPVEGRSSWADLRRGYGWSPWSAYGARGRHGGGA